MPPLTQPAPIVTCQLPIPYYVDDDITYESVAKAFNLGLEYHEPTLEKMNTIGLQMMKKAQEDAEKAGKPIVQRPEQTAQMLDARKRMALLPIGKDCDYVYAAQHLWVPIVRCNKNVHILPGVPRLFQTLVRVSLPTRFRSGQYVPSLYAQGSSTSSMPNSWTTFSSITSSQV